MSWDTDLISLYLELCKLYSTRLQYLCERFTNGGMSGFSDEEAMVIYLVGIQRGLRSIKEIHRYTIEHYSDWFPGLPRYATFVHRINRLSEAFRGLAEYYSSLQMLPDDERVYLVDSFPIVLAHHQHAYTATARVAQEISGKSYNATKKMYYYGVKAHVVARKCEGALPQIEFFVLESASRQDGPVFDSIRPELHDNLVFGDKAYIRPDAEQVEQEQNLKVLTPIPKRSGQKKLDPHDAAFSKAVSRIRQPIETLFGWLQRMTGIQNASAVRSTSGLLTHIFARMAAAFSIRYLPQGA